MLHTNVAGNSKHFRVEKKGGWICRPTWKLNFTRRLIRIDYTSPLQSRRAALRVPEPSLSVKKKLNYLNIFFYLNKSQKILLK